MSLKLISPLKKLFMLSKFGTTMLLCTLMLLSCNSGEKEKDGQPEENSFAADSDFLKKWDKDLITLRTENGNSMILLSPKYQGKVFTSTAGGQTGKSFGWINYGAFDKEPDAHMNAFGGEDRLWLGPEGGPFSLYFAGGKEMEFENWHTPPPIDIEPWDLVSSSEKDARLVKKMELKNYAGTSLKINIDRKIEILEPATIGEMLSVSLGDKVQAVGFRTTNTLQNVGDKAWDEQSGAPCMWSLDMFTPTPGTVIIIPYETAGEGKVATTDYFGEISPDRLKMEEGIIYFKADGLSRGKLGIPPQRVRPVAGSYAADAGVLTITLFDIDKNGTYLNQEWTTKKDPFSGDAMNAYNDGPLDDGTQMGPFYEIESVSPAAFLKPNEEMVHKHSVFHFTGDREALNGIATKVLGTTLSKISAVFDQ